MAADSGNAAGKPADSRREDGPEIWYILGENGEVIPMALPLGEGIPQRLRTGALARVNKDGSPYVERNSSDEDLAALPRDADPVNSRSDNGVKISEISDAVVDNARTDRAHRDPRHADLSVERPSDSAPVEAWREYAVNHRGAAAPAVARMNKAKLIEQFGRGDSGSS